MLTGARLIALILMAGLALSACSGGSRKPNVVILFADDMGYADLGSYGNPYIRTPNLDGLAREGQRWTDFYMAAPVCSPSRGALMTGQLPVRSGLYGRRMHVMFPGDSRGIPRQLLTMPEALGRAGYATGMFGKWHLGDAPANYPTRHGFDYWYGVPYSNDMDRAGAMGIDEVVELINAGETRQVMEHFSAARQLYKEPRSEYWQVPLYRSVREGDRYRDELVERPVIQPTFTRRITEEAIGFIRDNRDQPFLVYVPYSMPHLPLFRSEDFRGRSLRGRYGDTVEEIDWSVGRIRETLEELGLDDNTLVFFSSDNGPWQQVSVSGSGSAGPLKGRKATTYEGGVRVPGVFWWPGQIQPGVVSGIGSSLDLYTTVLRLAGVEVPDGIDGLDLGATLQRGLPSPRVEMPYYYKGKLAAYRKGRYKLYLYADGVTERKLEEPALYDLHEDISEEVDVAAAHPEVVADLTAAIERHRQTMTVAEPIFDMRFQKN